MSKTKVCLWFSGPAAGESVNIAPTPAELLVKIEALIRLCFSSVTETPIKAQANAHFIHFCPLTKEYKSSLRTSVLRNYLLIPEEYLCSKL